MKYLITSFFIFSCLVALPAQAEQLFTWQECVEEALRNHPDLVAAKARWEQAKASRVITRSALLPQISADLDYSDGKTTNKSFSYGVNGQQLIFDGFQTVNDVAAAQKEIEASRYAYEVISSDVRLRLRSAFIQLLNAQELLKVTEDIAERRRENLELIRLRYEGGREHRGSLLTAQADLAQAEFEVEQAKRNIDLSQRRLSKEMGREHFFTLGVEGKFQVAKLETQSPSFEGLADTPPFLQELIKQKEAAKYDLKASKSALFPAIFANAGVGRSDSHWPPRDESWSAGVSVSLPLFEGGAKKAAIDRSRAALTEAEANERSGRDEVILTLVQSWTSLQDAVGRVSVQEKFLQAAEERAQIAESQYSNGLVSFNDWIVIEDNLVSAKKNILSAQVNALIAEADWVQAKGGLLDAQEK